MVEGSRGGWGEFGAEGAHECDLLAVGEDGGHIGGFRLHGLLDPGSDLGFALGLCGVAADVAGHVDRGRNGDLGTLLVLAVGDGFLIGGEVLGGPGDDSGIGLGGCLGEGGESCGGDEGEEDESQAGRA